MSRTQVLHVSVSRDGGQTYQELRRQEYTFSPPGTTFEREEWTVTVDGGHPPATRDHAGQGGCTLLGDPDVAGLTIRP